MNYQPIELAKLAWDVRSRAYAPYSNYKVGCVVYDGENVFYGANVENSSFGVTICAERIALAAWVISPQRHPVETIVFATDSIGRHFSPCGTCLQFMMEFISGDCLVGHFNGHHLKEWKFSSVVPPHAVNVLRAVGKKQS